LMHAEIAVAAGRYEEAAELIETVPRSFPTGEDLLGIRRPTMFGRNVERVREEIALFTGEHGAHLRPLWELVLAGDELSEETIRAALAPITQTALQAYVRNWLLAAAAGRELAELRQPSSHGGKSLTAAVARYADAHAFRLMMAFDALDPYWQDGRSKRTLLHYAAEEAEPLVLAYLVDAGVDINSTDSSGSTPLYAAFTNRRIDNVRWLRERGAHLGQQAERARRWADSWKPKEHHSQRDRDRWQALMDAVDFDALIQETDDQEPETVDF
ncbi:MAG: ankyrin repeat domain-containing protein, partial [Planctomycetota bacterium]